jgi:hypothetical protein
MGASVLPEPPEKVKAILADPAKRAAIHPAILQILDKVAPVKPDATATGGLDPVAAQGQGAIPIVSKALRDNITPFGYEVHSQEMKNAVMAMLGRDPTEQDRQESIKATSVARGELPQREDAWNLFLGLPQVANTFMPSPFKPSNGGENKRYLSLRQSPINPEMLSGYVRLLEVNKEQGRTARTYDNRDMVMGTYKLDLGKDDHGHYISYYDKWDLEPQIVNLLGKPFEIYGRQYYDPKTFQPLSPDLTGLHLKEIQDWAGKNLTAVPNARSSR